MPSWSVVQNQQMKESPIKKGTLVSTTVVPHLMLSYAPDVKQPSWSHWEHRRCYIAVKNLDVEVQVSVYEDLDPHHLPHEASTPESLSESTRLLTVTLPAAAAAGNGAWLSHAIRTAVSGARTVEPAESVDDFPAIGDVTVHLVRFDPPAWMREALLTR